MAVPYTWMQLKKKKKKKSFQHHLKDSKHLHREYLIQLYNLMSQILRPDLSKSLTLLLIHAHTTNSQCLFFFFFCSSLYPHIPWSQDYLTTIGFTFLYLPWPWHSQLLTQGDVAPSAILADSPHYLLPPHTHYHSFCWEMNLGLSKCPVHPTTFHQQRYCSLSGDLSPLPCPIPSYNMHSQVSTKPHSQPKCLCLPSSEEHKKVTSKNYHIPQLYALSSLTCWAPVAGPMTCGQHPRHRMLWM